MVQVCSVLAAVPSSHARDQADAGRPGGLQILDDGVQEIQLLIPGDRWSRHLQALQPRPATRIRKMAIRCIQGSPPPLLISLSMAVRLAFRSATPPSSRSRRSLNRASSESIFAATSPILLVTVVLYSAENDEIDKRLLAGIQAVDNDDRPRSNCSDDCDDFVRAAPRVKIVVGGSALALYLAQCVL